MLTTEPVLAEVAHFWRADRVDVDPLFPLLERDVLQLDPQVAEHWPRLRTLMARYEQMDLADASIVVMSERHPRSRVFTVDRTDFNVYRPNDRQVIDFLSLRRNRKKRIRQRRPLRKESSIVDPAKEDDRFPFRRSASRTTTAQHPDQRKVLLGPHVVRTCTHVTLANRSGREAYALRGIPGPTWSCSSGGGSFLPRS